jgi:hypothetical protein
MKHVPAKHPRTAPRSWFGMFRGYGGTFAVIAAVASVAITVFSVMSYNKAARFDRDGVATLAEVMDRRIDRSGDDDDYYVTFRFDAAGQRVERERSVSRGLYRTAPWGAMLEIRYLPDQPTTFETYVGQARDNAVSLQVIAGIAGVAALIILWVFGGRANRAILARRLGYRTVAVVDAVIETKNSGRPSGKGYMVWRTADGVRGESLRHPIGTLRAIGRDAEINVYVRKGHSVWEGDVGPRHVPDSQLPKVRR